MHNNTFMSLARTLPVAILLNLVRSGGATG